MFKKNGRALAMPANEMNGAFYANDAERVADSGYGTVTAIANDGLHGLIVTVKLDKNGRKVERYVKYGEVSSAE